MPDNPRDGDAERLSERLRQHVQERGGPTRNGAWQMMLDAARELDARDAALRDITAESVGHLAEIARFQEENDRLRAELATIRARSRKEPNT